MLGVNSSENRLPSAYNGSWWSSSLFTRIPRLAWTVEANDRDLQMTSLSMMFYWTGTTISISLYTWNSPETLTPSVVC